MSGRDPGQKSTAGAAIIKNNRIIKPVRTNSMPKLMPREPPRLSGDADTKTTIAVVMAPVTIDVDRLGGRQFRGYFKRLRNNR